MGRPLETREIAMRISILAMSLALALVTGPLVAATPKPDVGPGRIAWFDISTIDLPKSKEFYGKLFDWRFTPLKGTDLTAEIVAGGTLIGALRVAEGKIGAFNGVVYVQVIDIQASCQKATQLGGTVVPGFPFNLADDRGAIALIVDPAGHPIGMYSRTPIPPVAAQAP